MRHRSPALRSTNVSQETYWLLVIIAFYVMQYWWVPFIILAIGVAWLIGRGYRFYVKRPKDE